MFRTLLIANRGEIALRIARTADRLGIRTVMVHSEADTGAPWLDAADRTVCVGPSKASASYLDLDAILQAAEQSDCQAVHPGYGFLSENPVFAAACIQQGLAFVGPGPGAMLVTGNKIRAKRAMAEAGVPVIPGSDGAVHDADEAAALADRIGYPVLLKAAAGGGGKGMRACAEPTALRAAFVEAANEADKAFGDPALYLERLIVGGRHVEFQVLCDAFGGAIHLGERECSVQRNHQKLVEESPSPALSPEERSRFGERVARAMAAIGYCNAGTVEFLRAPDGEMYFMEVNARLQVEHPVTEVRTGVDLVEMQLRIAALEPLPLSQANVRFEGHGIELRINAEDPDDGFRPDPGEITAFRAPPPEAGTARVRWDSAVRAGYRVPPYYDSLIGKLIVHAADREGAIAGAVAALDRTDLQGIKTTIPLHRKVLAHERFRSGQYDVGFLHAAGLAG